MIKAHEVDNTASNDKPLMFIGSYIEDGAVKAIKIYGETNALEWFNSTESVNGNDRFPLVRLIRKNPSGRIMVNTVTTIHRTTEGLCKVWDTANATSSTSKFTKQSL